MRNIYVYSLFYRANLNSKENLKIYIMINILPKVYSKHNQIMMITNLQGWEFAQCSFAQIAQIKQATVSYLFRSLMTNEQLWANRSGRSCQKSNREWITQVAHDNWDTMSDSLRLLMINEQMSDSLKKFN